jgi:excisionase family DNA binding protein
VARCLAAEAGADSTAAGLAGPTFAAQIISKLRDRETVFMTTSSKSEWLTAAEAALYLRVAHRTVLEWAKTGRIPAHRLSGTLRVTYRFRAAELDAMLCAPSAAENGEFNATG